jgi:hypothetical protein
MTPAISFNLPHESRRKTVPRLAHRCLSSYKPTRFGWKLGLLAQLIGLLLYPCAISATSFRQSNDIVYMLNGDKITCEIKSLSQGQLSVKPGYTNATIVIDWTKVDRLQSAQLFVVTGQHGSLYTGTLSGGPQKGTLTIAEAKVVTLQDDSVVEIAELGNSFIRQLSGNISIGTSFARSNAQSSLTVQSGLKYHSKRNEFGFNWNSQFATQKETSNTSETTVKTGYFHQSKRPNWYRGVFANFLSSSEQQITLESTIGGALAKRAIFTNKTNLTLIGGLGYTTQKNTDGESNGQNPNSMDAAFAVQFSTFRFDSANFDTTFWVYPSLTDPGHVRMTLNQDVYYKFAGDLYVSVSFYDNYDNRPVRNAPSNNFGATTSIGWSFH